MWYMMENVQNSYDLSDRLIRAINNWQAFSVADEDDIEDLIDKGADVNRLHGTLLPLHCSCMVSDSYTLRLLIQKGAKVNAIDGYGRAALHYAAERDVFCVEILLENGADINTGDGNQDTALHWAAFKNNVSCVKLLLQHGAQVDPEDFNCDTPLSWAARKGHLEVIKILLEYNASVDSRNLNGDTPLMRAATVQASGLNTEVDDACFELLLKVSGQFELRNNKEKFRNQIASDNKLNEMLMPLCQNVRALQDLCRYTIRKTLGYKYLPNVIPKLPIPTRIREQLLLKS